MWANESTNIKNQTQPFAQQTQSMIQSKYKK